MEWKRPLLIGVGWGLGTAVGLAVLLGGFLWYQSRPKPPKPWNSAPIKARYDYADTEGDKNTVVLYYTLENTTDFDYRIEDDRNVELNAKRKQQNNLSRLGERGRIDYPVIVPAKKRVELLIHINYACPVRTTANPADAQETEKHGEDVEKFMVSEWANLDGFDLLDESKRYEIIFPAGWKHSAKQAEAH